MYFEIIGEIEEIETIAVGGRIRDIMRLRKQYGLGRWRKLREWQMFAFKAEEFAKLKSTGTKLTA